MSFGLVINKPVDGMYIFSNGGDKPKGTGVAMYYLRNQLYVTVSTKEYQWTVSTYKFSLGTYMKFEYSWSMQIGLEIYINDEKVAHTNKYIKKNMEQTSHNISESFRFGTIQLTNTISSIVIAEITVTFASKNLAILIPEISTSKYIIFSILFFVTKIFLFLIFLQHLVPMPTAM